MVLEMQGLKKCYGEKEALKSLDLKLESGIYGLLGTNGAGKSTLMKLISMLIEPTEGKILFDGKDICTQKKTFLKELGYMPQQPCLYGEFTLLEYLYYIGALKGMAKAHMMESAALLLKKMQLYPMRNQKIKTLSGGMQQRLMFAQALLDDPKVVILDEPTAGLDPQKRIEMRNLIAEYSKDKMILIATHVVSDVELIANEILLLRKGVLIAKDCVQGLTQRLVGKVYEIEAKESLQELEQNYRVSSMYHRDGKIYAKILLEDEREKPKEAVSVYPDLEDVYLYYLGKED